jgi:hypothetical protein
VLGPSTALAAWRGISPDPELQLDPVALELDVIQLDLAILLAFLGVAWLSWTVAYVGSRGPQQQAPSG